MSVKQVFIIFFLATGICVGLAVGRNYYSPLKDATMFLDGPFNSIQSSVSETLRGNPLALLGVLSSSVTIVIGAVKLVKDRVITPIKDTATGIKSTVAMQGEAIYQVNDELKTSVTGLTEQQQSTVNELSAFKTETARQFQSFRSEIDTTKAENEALAKANVTQALTISEYQKRIDELTPRNFE